MDDKKVIRLKIKQSTEQETEKKTFSAKLQTNPILQKMLSINESSAKMKFKLKDWFK